MMLHKKGQGLSLNVIIIAALALIVLVVLVVIFTSRTADFDQKVGKESETELIKMRIQYGDCQPATEQELSFRTTFAQAQTELEQEQARNTFEDEISRCKSFSEEANCDSASCQWG